MRVFGALLLCVAVLNGCSSLRPKLTSQYVYVTAKQTFLRDRVAAVSNRTGTVANGQKLEVLEHGRRFLRVRTEKGELGWIDEKAVATQTVYDAFTALKEGRKNDPAVASAVVRDEVNLHLKPGRDTDVLYRLVEGDKVQLLQRATLPKALPAGMTPAKAASKTPPAAPTTTDPPAPPPPIPMEDWWLVRDAQGRSGWMLSRRMDVDAPDSLTNYGEGQRFVGAYVLTTVHDDGVPGDNKDIPIYVTVLSPPTAGLPYDFDQVRVFTWSLKKHRYETGFREKNIEGYLPVSIKSDKDPYGKSALAQESLPTFTYKVLAADAGDASIDPATGVANAGRTISRTYRLEGNLVRRIAPPGAHDEPAAHPVVVEKKDKKGKKGKK